MTNTTHDGIKMLQKTVGDFFSAETKHLGECSNCGTAWTKHTDKIVVIDHGKGFLNYTLLCEICGDRRKRGLPAFTRGGTFPGRVIAEAKKLADSSPMVEALESIKKARSA